MGEEVTDLTVSLHQCRSSVAPTPASPPAGRHGRRVANTVDPGLTGFASDHVHAGSAHLILGVEPPTKNQETVSATASMSLYPGNSHVRVHWAEEFTARQMLWLEKSQNDWRKYCLISSRD